MCLQNLGPYCRLQLFMCSSFCNLQWSIELALCLNRPQIDICHETRVPWASVTNSRYTSTSVYHLKICGQCLLKYSVKVSGVVLIDGLYSRDWFWLWPFLRIWKFTNLSLHQIARFLHKNEHLCVNPMWVHKNKNKRWKFAVIAVLSVVLCWPQVCHAGH